MPSPSGPCLPARTLAAGYGIMTAATRIFRAEILRNVPAMTLLHGREGGVGPKMFCFSAAKALINFVCVHQS